MPANLHLRPLRSLVHLCGFLFSLGILLAAGSARASEDNPREKIQQELRQMERRAGFDVRDTAYINRLTKLAGHMRFYEADSLLKLAEQALEYSQKAGYKAGEVQAYIRQGDYHSDKGASDQAISYYRQGLKLAESIGDRKLALRIHNNLSGEYAYKSDYARALTSYLESLELAEEIGELLMQSIINENIANLYAEQKDYEQSLAYYKRVKRINDSLDNDVVRAETLSNLASVYADMGQLEYAMFNVNQSIDIFEEHRILDWLAFAYETKGKVYLKKFNYKWAIYWYNQSDMLHLDLEDDRSRIDLLNGMAEAHFGQGSDSLATAYATEAFQISNNIKFTEGIRDCAQTLYRIHRKQEDYATALAYHVLFQELSDSIAKNESRQSLSLLKTRTEYEKQKQDLIAENEKALAQQRRYIQAGWVMLLIAVIIIYLILRSKKLQKRLNEELRTNQDILEKRKAELQAIDKTKTKLFSIIGHDLRGPIGALQEALKMISNKEIGREEFLSFMPRLRSDVDHIFFTLNNLLSWGYSQLNGSVNRPAAISLESVVQDNINLLSEIADGKSIRIISELPGHTPVWADPNQIDIIVRNLISNALKFTPENGIVTIGAEEKDLHWVISVRDTGVGMDRIALGRMFKDKNNHSTYGTNNEKGTGLGLVLCKEMVEKNNGKIWVDSVLRKGTTFFFTLPKSAENYSQAV